MSIQPGDRIPEVALKRIRDGVETVDTRTLFDGKKVLLFSVPGAFTPTCSEKPPARLRRAFRDFRASGIEVACMSVNDPFVMQAWGEASTCRRASKCWLTATAISRAHSAWKWMRALTAWARGPSVSRCMPKMASSSRCTSKRRANSACRLPNTYSNSWAKRPDSITRNRSPTTRRFRPAR